MGKIVFVGLCHLRKKIGTYEQFISVFFLLTMLVSFYGTAPRYQPEVRAPGTNTKPDTHGDT